MHFIIIMAGILVEGYAEGKPLPEYDVVKQLGENTILTFDEILRQKG